MSNTIDEDNAEANSSVWVGGCTGTLIKSDIVITAGHCVNRPSGFEAEDGQWYSTTVLENRRTSEIGFGYDRENFRLVLKATYFSILDGADIALLALESPVNSQVAIPKKVLLDAPVGISWSRQSFRQVGWGMLSATAGAPALRRSGSAIFRQFPCYTFQAIQADKICVNGSQVRAGDSGGPLYWMDSRGGEWLVGVAQGTEGNGGRYVPTFLQAGAITVHDDGRRTEEPDISSFLKQHLASSACSQIRAQALDRSPTVPLVSWYSRSRNDNSTTANKAWQGCQGDTQSPDYGFTRIEGIIFSPDRPQPEGTIPLHKWYSPDRGDNWTTSQHFIAAQRREGLSPNYRFVRIEGYIYPPSLDRRSGVVPLYSWYSPSRMDNWVTTQHREKGERGENLSPDYRFVRLEGYVLDPSSEGGPH
ncbi:MAG: S1 family peptidase [Nitrospirales bacterium]|nr:S1 family peptidase [Nitrospirales bacterium]